MKRFWDKVQKTNTCWNWIGAIKSNGYGLFWWERKNISAHRFSYILNKSIILNGFNVCHTCDNRKCVNPDHLVACTQSENLIDAYKRKRKTSVRRKLTDEKVISIRSKYSKGNSYRKLAKEYGVSTCCIVLIIKNKTYAKES